MNNLAASKMSILKRKLVQGAGINDANYNVTTGHRSNRSWCPYYRTWIDMIKRCYSESYAKANPSYKYCMVCDEWLTFSNFKKWMESQNWQGKQLDKDILKPGNKIYSSKTCVFVSQKLNLLLIHKKVKSELPPGVYFHKAAKKYCAELKANMKKVYLGLFNSVDDASLAYKKAKRKEILRVASMETNTNIRDGLIAHAEML